MRYSNATPRIVYPRIEGETALKSGKTLCRGSKMNVQGKKRQDGWVRTQRSLHQGNQDLLSEFQYSHTDMTLSVVLEHFLYLQQTPAIRTNDTGYQLLPIASCPLASGKMRHKSNV
jgi:hypothetical protein